MPHSELRTDEIIRDALSSQTKSVFIPYTPFNDTLSTRPDMVMMRLKDMNAFETGLAVNKWGIREVVSASPGVLEQAETTVGLDLVIMPGVCITWNTVTRAKLVSLQESPLIGK